MNDFTTVESVARRYAHRPGCRFVSAQEVGIAVFVLDLRVILIEPREVPPIDEFLLRAMSLSVGSPGELSNFLGLDLRTVQNRLVELRRGELIELEPAGADGDVHCHLTVKGRSATDSLHRAELSEVTLPRVVYHGFLRKPLLMTDEQLFKPKEMRDFGLRTIPAIPGRPPRPEEIKLTELAEVVKQYWARRKKGKTPELVSVRSVLKGVRTLYQKAILLQYELIGRKKQQQITFAVDGLIMDDYERAFTACKGPERIPNLIEEGFKSTAAVASEFMKPHLVTALGPLGDVDDLLEQIDAIEGKVTEKEATIEAEDRPDTKQVLRAELEREKAEKAELERKLAQRKVRRLKTFDCKHLRAATLRDVKERLVIVSAFLSTGVVDDEFLKKLEAALARGVKVWIAYGLSGQGGRDGDREQSPDWRDAEAGLERLRKKYQDTFQLKNFGNVHEKILLRDNDFVVSGSFNWLSFRGDWGRRFRYEDALQVTEPAVIEEYFTEITARFAKKK
jgi:PLD-like domain